MLGHPQGNRRIAQSRPMLHRNAPRHAGHFYLSNLLLTVYTMTFWLQWWFAWEIAARMAVTDASSFMMWRDWSIDGVPNIAGC